MATPLKYWLNSIKKAICIRPSWGHAIMPEKPLLYSARPCRNNKGFSSHLLSRLQVTSPTHQKQGRGLLEPMLLCA
jgi:hypothetical protein